MGGLPVHAVGSPEPGFYLPLVQSFLYESEKTDLGAVFVFTSTSPREGVSFVTAAVGRELAALTGEKVLVAASRAIGNFAPVPGTDSSEPVIREGNNVFHLRPPQSPNGASRVEKFELLGQLNKLFRFVLVDSPALSVSAEALEYGVCSQGIVLVAAAGQVHRSRLVRAKGMIEAAGVPLLGCALNRRTYPIPGFLYKRL